MGGTDQRPLAIAPAAFAIATREGPQNVDSRRRSDGSNAQLPDIRERPGERVKSTVSGRSRNGPGDMSDGGEPEGAGSIDDACRRQDRYGRAQAVFVSGRHRHAEIHILRRQARCPGPGHRARRCQPPVQ
jgi:hypothetical protein